MAGGRDQGPQAPRAPKIGQRRRILGVVLAINLIMFAVEIGAGWRAQSLALQADALDFLGDSVNYAVALFVLSRSLAWRAGTALIKGAVMLGFGVFLAGASAYHALTGSAPEAAVMGVVGGLALAANVACALLLANIVKWGIPDRTPTVPKQPATPAASPPNNASSSTPGTPPRER